MRDYKEELGQLIDRLDNLASALQLPMRAELHVKGLKDSLPEAVKEAKDIFVGIFNENPWA